MIAATPLKPDDAQRMANLHALAFPKGQAWSADAFSGLLKQPSVQAEGLIEGSDLFAFILVQVAVAEAEILTIATAPTHRQRGMARYLLNGIQQRLMLAGLEKWLLDVAADNPGAIQFYEKLGFQVDGHRPNYYKRLEGSRVDAILMSKSVAGQATK